MSAEYKKRKKLKKKRKKLKIKQERSFSKKTLFVADTENQIAINNYRKSGHFISRTTLSRPYAKIKENPNGVAASILASAFRGRKETTPQKVPTCGRKA